RRRRGQHRHLSARTRALRRRQRDRAHQRPPEPGILRPARYLADRLGHRRDHGPHRARGARARAGPAARAAQGEARDRRGYGRQGGELPGQAGPRAPAPGRRAADLRRARRQGRDPGRGDPAPDRRQGARDPRAGQESGAPQGTRVAGGHATVWAVRRPATPVALAWAATLAGMISIVSALTPEFADRTDLIDGVLPPGIPEAARTVALALGLAMIFLSRGLARRKQRAWTLAVALVIASAIAHLAKGLDFEEAIVHIA